MRKCNINESGRFFKDVISLGGGAYSSYTDGRAYCVYTYVDVCLELKIRRQLIWRAALPVRVQTVSFWLDKP